MKAIICQFIDDLGDRDFMTFTFEDCIFSTSYDVMKTYIRRCYSDYKFEKMIESTQYGVQEVQELFSCCAPTLEECRRRRDNWLQNL